MDQQAIKDWLMEIEAFSWDPGRAHSMEDSLYIVVLTAIKDGVELPEELAALALEARDIKFARWCA